MTERKRRLDPFKEDKKKTQIKETIYPTMELIPLYNKEPNCKGEMELLGFYDRKITKNIYLLSNRDYTGSIFNFTRLIDSSFAYHLQHIHDAMMKFPEYQEVFEETVKSVTPKFQENEIVVGIDHYQDIYNQKFKVGSIIYLDSLCSTEKKKDLQACRLMTNIKTNEIRAYNERWFTSISDHEKLLAEKKEVAKHLAAFKKALKTDTIGAELRYMGKTYRF